MIDEREVVTEESATPRWISIAVVALALVSFVGLGFGWAASNHAKALEQTMGAQQRQQQQFNQDEEMLGQRLAKAEETNAQLQGELGVVTDKVKPTKTELRRAHVQAIAIKAYDAKQLADLQNNVTGQLATKASVDDVTRLGTDVTGVKTDLETTNNNLTITKGEFGTLIAKNHDEVEELRRMGDRDYYEFTIDKKDQRKKIGETIVQLRGVNAKKNLYSVAMYVDDSRYDKKNRSANEPIYFFTHGSRAPLEFVVNQIGKDKITGYLSVPKTPAARTQVSGN